MGIGRIKSSPDVGQVSDEQRMHRAHRVRHQAVRSGKVRGFSAGTFHTRYKRFSRGEQRASKSLNNIFSILYYYT